MGESPTAGSIGLTSATISQILQPIVTLFKEYMQLYFELYLIATIFGMMQSLFSNIRLPGLGGGAV